MSAPSYHAGPTHDDRQGPIMDTGDWLAVLAAAAVAPSIHNTQPWRFVMRPPDAVELHLDPARVLPALDPTGREARISCGAALLSVRVALRASGALPAVTLLPVRRHPTLLAVMRVARRREATPEELMLHGAISSRNGHRHPYAPGRVPMAALRAIVCAAGAEGGYLRMVPSSPMSSAIEELASHAAQAQRQDPACRLELDAASEPDRPHEPLPLGVLMSASDTELDQLRCGQALQRALLTAAGYGVGAVILSAPTELPGARAALQRLVGCTMSPQLVLRFGGTLPAVASPRRPVTQFVVMPRAAPTEPA